MTNLLSKRSNTVLGAFFDDSGTHSSSRVVSMGGLLGTEMQWDHFASAWEEQLKDSVPNKPPLKQFHLSECEARRGAFENYNQTEQEYLTGQFRRIILGAGMVTVAAAVNKIAWDELVTTDVTDKLGSPLEVCFFKCTESVVQIMRVQKPSEKIYFCFDQGVRASIEPMARLLETQYSEIERIFFAPVKKVVALQGADMIATETNRYAQECMRNPNNPIARPNFRDFIYRDLSAGLFFDREQIKEMVDHVRSLN